MVKSERNVRSKVRVTYILQLKNYSFEVLKVVPEVCNVMLFAVFTDAFPYAQLFFFNSLSSFIIISFRWQLYEDDNI